jgi:hypothetical protein
VEWGVQDCIPDTPSRQNYRLPKPLKHKPSTLPLTLTPSYPSLEFSPLCPLRKRYCMLGVVRQISGLFNNVTNDTVISTGWIDDSTRFQSLPLHVHVIYYADNIMKWLLWVRTCVCRSRFINCYLYWVFAHHTETHSYNTTKEVINVKLNCAGWNTLSFLIARTTTYVFCFAFILVVNSYTIIILSLDFIFDRAVCIFFTSKKWSNNDQTLFSAPDKQEILTNKKTYLIIWWACNINIIIKK